MANVHLRLQPFTAVLLLLVIFTLVWKPPDHWFVTEYATVQAPDAGGLLLGGFALLWSLVGVIRHRGGDRRRLVHALLLLAAWVLGLVNALVHAKDAWAMMPEGLWLSAIAAVLALLASWTGYLGFREWA